MADPFEVLRAPIDPIAPDPSFAAELRARLQRALELPKGVTVSNLTLEQEAKLTDAGSLTGITPYLAVAGAQQALSWYSEAFGARVRGEPIVMPDGRIGHAELEIAGGILMLSEQYPEIGVVAPVAGGGVSVTIHLAVPDVDAVVDAAVAAGASLERPPADFDYGRNGVVRDPFGHRWMISSEPERATIRHGDIGYVSLFVPDIDRAAAFFSGVLDWSYGPGSGPQGLQVEGQSLSHGLWGGQERATLFLCFAVDDLSEAVRRVRDAGGDAREPHEESYGLISECTDDQGVAFAVYQPPADQVARGPRPPRHGALEGDIAYLTMEVVDSQKARTFYGQILGWRFAPGRVTDGWQVEDVAPMIGMSGGHEDATVVPMYRVQDIDVAVSNVRSHAGTATEPETQPYGITSQCTDDQGTRFYLGQL